MEQAGEYEITAPREAVWSALNDADTLGACIPGCLDMQRVSDDQFEAKVKAKIGPVSATFTAQLQLTQVCAPESYTIVGNVKGGAAGFGKGSADVELSEIDTGTRLQYAVKASVGGKLAQIGSRLVDSAARKMADDFFAAFSQQLNSAQPLQTSTSEQGTSEPAATLQTSQGKSQGESQGRSQGEQPGAEAAEVNAPSPSREYEKSGNAMFWGIAFAVLALAIVLAL